MKVAISGYYANSSLKPPLHFGLVLIDKINLADWMMRTSAVVETVVPWDKDEPSSKQ